MDDGLLPKLDSNNPLNNWCRKCGANIPPKEGEGTCEHCAPKKQSRAEQKIARERWEEYQRIEEFYQLWYYF